MGRSDFFLHFPGVSALKRGIGSGVLRTAGRYYLLLHVVVVVVVVGDDDWNKKKAGQFLHTIALMVLHNVLYSMKERQNELESQNKRSAMTNKKKKKKKGEANNKAFITTTTTTTTTPRAFYVCIAAAVLLGLVATANVYLVAFGDLALSSSSSSSSIVTTVADLPLTAVPVLILACIHWVAWQLYIHN